MLRNTTRPLLGSEAGKPAVQVAWAPQCYMCGERYREVDAYFHQLCPACARLSAEKRAAPLAVAGRRALVTGGRVKIGRATALRLLRAGAHVVVTSRFKAQAQADSAGEPDYPAFGDRLKFVALDFRDATAVGAPPFGQLFRNFQPGTW